MSLLTPSFERISFFVQAKTLDRRLASFKAFYSSLDLSNHYLTRIL